MTVTVQKLTAKIVKKNILTQDLFIVWIRPESKFLFEPGQYCTLGLNGTERDYSIASAPFEKDLELFLEMVPSHLRTEKSFTPKINELEMGAHVALQREAKGRFLLDENCETHVMISTVTGVAPFISMLRAYIHGDYKKKYKIYVFQGASYQDEFGYDEELMKMAKTGKITYVPTVSRPKEARNNGWKGATGRVNEIVQAQFQKHGIVPENTAIYLCGHRGMIDDLGKLDRRGFSIRREVYF